MPASAIDCAQRISALPSACVWRGRFSPWQPDLIARGVSPILRVASPRSSAPGCLVRSCALPCSVVPASPVTCVARRWRAPTWAVGACTFARFASRRSIDGPRWGSILSLSAPLRTLFGLGARGFRQAGRAANRSDTRASNGCGLLERTLRPRRCGRGVPVRGALRRGQSRPVGD